MNATAATSILLTGLCTPLAAQTPSVLDLQKSYHVGIYGGTVETSTGALRLLAQIGDMDLTSTGSVSGALDTWETDLMGTVFTADDPFGADYTVRADGVMVFDFDPSNPGTDVIGLWVDAAGSVLHMARASSEEDAISVLAIEKSTGQSLASLSGSYAFAGQRMEFAGTQWDTFGEWGVLTFDGLGGGTVTGTELAATQTGSTSLPFSGSFAYTVQADGAITLDGSRGAMSADGELLFVITASASSGEVGMAIGVRTGAAGSYDFNDLAGRYGVSGQSIALGAGPFLPLVGTNFGEARFTATSATAGSWSVAGVLIESNELNITANPWSDSGSATLAGNGTLTLANPPGSIELGVSSNANYFVGRDVGTTTSLFFGMRQCGLSFGSGSGTAGTGGEAPVLGMKTFPQIGNAGWRYAVANGLGGAICVIPIGFAPLPGVPALGGMIWVDPTSVGYTPLVVLGGTPGMAGAGSAEVPLPIPNNTGLVGVSLHAQAIVLDPAGPVGFALSNGFAAAICR